MLARNAPEIRPLVREMMSQIVLCDSMILKNCNLFGDKCHSRNLQVRIDLVASPRGLDPFWVSVTWNQCQKDPEMGHSDVESELISHCLISFQKWVRPSGTQNPSQSSPGIFKDQMKSISDRIGAVYSQYLDHHFVIRNNERLE